MGAAAVVQPGEVTLVPAGSPYDAGALWLRTPETFEDFDVSFRARVDHVSNAAPPSDGFTFAWLHDAMGNAAPGDSSADRALGVPSGFAGYGVEYDTYRMMTGYLHVDPTRGVPGQYPWEVPGTLQSMSFVMNTWHDVTVRLRAGALTASVDGVPWSASAPGFQPFAGYMGFTAHSGYAGDGFDLSQFHASFEQPGCDP